MKYIIDRFEEDYAIIEGEDMDTFNLPKHMIPKDAMEGDILEIEVKLKQDDTEQRKKRIENLMDDLWN